MQDEIIDIIVKQIHNSASDSEKGLLLDWLARSEENKRFYSLFLANYTLHDSLTSGSLERDRESMINRLNARIDAVPQRPVFPFRGWVAGFAAVAAAVALFVFFNWRGARPAEEAPAPMEQLANSTPETIHLVLDDGTRVYLSPGSRMTYNVSTLPASREVTLTGDAYFDVTRNEDKPFYVHTENIGVRVLGTAFSVSSSAEVSQVVLERGSVRLLSPEGGSMVTLSPNQKATFKSITGDVRVEPVYATAFVTDKYNLMTISDATLPQILSRVSSVYKKRIRCKGGDREKRYNLAFLKSDTLEDVLSIVEYLTGAECEIE